MKKPTHAPLERVQTDVINARQLGLFLAFFLPCARLLELPRLLAEYAGGDLLLPALVGLINEFFAVFALFLTVKKLKKSIFQMVAERFGSGFSKTLYALYAAFFLLSSFVPLLDAEKFSHAAFSDASPTFFAFAPFFLLSGFVCVKGIKAIGRSADLTPLLFCIPLLGIFVMSVGQADFTALLPLFEKPVLKTAAATYKVLPHFLGGALAVPLVGGAYEYKDGDGKRILPAYAVGAVITLLFLAVFYGVYGPLAPKTHYAVSKIAQYFPALAVVGRIDLLFVYAFTVVLFFYVALPLQLSVDCFVKATGFGNKPLISAVLNVVLFVLILFFNRHYDTLYVFFSETLALAYIVFTLVLPQLAPLLLLGKKKNDRGRYQTNAKKEKKNAR